MRLTRDNLRKLYEMQRELSREEMRLIELRERATSVPSALGGSGDRVQNSVTNRAGIYSEMAVDLERELTQTRAAIKALRTDTQREIKIQIKDKHEAEVLIYRYVYCLTYEDIASLMKYTERRIYQLHKTAMSRIEEE